MKHIIYHHLSEIRLSVWNKALSDDKVEGQSQDKIYLGDMSSRWTDKNDDEEVTAPSSGKLRALALLSIIFIQIQGALIYCANAISLKQ